jgi:16S rRNA (cytidine1402-2'-O)-methyltransferase
MGTLYIVATPIGNLGDITIRAIETLLSVDIVASEDTRVTGQLLHHLEEKYSTIFSCSRNPDERLIRFDQVTEPKLVPEIIDLLEKGKNIALVTDAGTPLISDPGHVLVSRAISCAIPVIAIPGPSAFLTALTMSGRPIDRFSYFGFVPEKENAVKSFLSSMLDVLTQTKMSICYVSPPSVK